MNSALLSVFFLILMTVMVDGQADAFTSGTILQPWGGALGSMSYASAYPSYSSSYSSPYRSGYNYNNYGRSTYGNPYYSNYANYYHPSQYYYNYYY